MGEEIKKNQRSCTRKAGTRNIKQRGLVAASWWEKSIEVNEVAGINSTGSKCEQDNS